MRAKLKPNLSLPVDSRYNNRIAAVSKVDRREPLEVVLWEFSHPFRSVILVYRFHSAPANWAQCLPTPSVPGEPLLKPELIAWCKLEPKISFQWRRISTKINQEFRESCAVDGKENQIRMRIFRYVIFVSQSMRREFFFHKKINQLSWITLWRNW